MIVDEDRATGGGQPPVAHSEIQRWSKKLSCLPQPILAGKVVDAGELRFIVGDDGVAECNDLSGDEQIVAADRRTYLFEASAERGIDGVGGDLERQIVIPPPR